MQLDKLKQKLKEEAEKIRFHLQKLEEGEHLTSAETEEFLQQSEKLYRHLSAYHYLLKSKETANTDMQVHLKIMQTVTAISEQQTADSEKHSQSPGQEGVMGDDKIIIPKQETENGEEKKQNIDKNLHAEVTNPKELKNIEFSINDKFRMVNELFSQNQKEFQTVLQQLNSTDNMEEAEHYFNSLKDIYGWKDTNTLVKSLYMAVQKRFS